MGDRENSEEVIITGNEKSAEKFTVGKVDEVPIAAQRSYIKETNIEVLT